LIAMGSRTMIAGDFPNMPENLAHWVQAPTSMKPKTAMPDLGLTDQQARDVAAYLETLR
jgi:cytochrome c1